MDSFYASCEEKRKPELKGKPIVVCVYSARGGDSGAVGTASYEARKKGVHSAMPISIARKKLPEGIFLTADFEYYHAVSERVMEILSSNCDSFEQASVDEAFMEVTEKCGGKIEEATEAAKKIKKEILKREGLPCTIGIACNKLLAKMASKAGKPNGLFVVEEGKEREFLEKLPVGKLLGAGRVAQDEFEKMGIEAIGGLQKISLDELVEKFGESRGNWFYNACRGIDESQVQGSERKQFGRIVTLKADSSDFGFIAPVVGELCSEVFARSVEEGKKFRTASMVFVDSRIQGKTRSKTIEPFVKGEKEFQEACLALLKKFLGEIGERKLRRVGVSASNFLEETDGKEQKTLGEY
jgi:DNA polymerase IV (DinB-like DNA polymerase)